MTPKVFCCRIFIFCVAFKPVTSWVPPHSSIARATTASSSAATSSSDNKMPTSKPLPRVPIPEPICSETPGTWAYDTMSRRINEEILERTYQDNKETLQSPAFADILAEYNALRQELRNAATTPLTYLTDMVDSQPKEFIEWNDQILAPLVATQATWLSAPWMVAEFYVYRRLMQAIGYFNKDSPGYKYDPFTKAKRDGLVSSISAAEPMLLRLPQLVASANIQEGVCVAADWALWGNRMDLSLWPVNADADAADSDSSSSLFTDILEKANENLLADDSDKLASLAAQLQAIGGGTVDVIVDNAGFELVTDLALAQYLIESGIAKVVTFQLKLHPTFVSDALEKDLRETVDYYVNLDAAKYPGAQAAGNVWKDLLASGQWKCNEDPFWCQPFAMWDMTEPLRTDMANRCDLAFVKGDANYRRLLGDCMWDMTLPFADVVGAYFPCPVCALRTLKAEIGCGMDKEQIDRAKGLDDKWMVNGRFGVVHFGSEAAEKDA